MAAVPLSSMRSGASGAATASASDLSMRETVLGMMRARDVRGVGSIHTSDFRYYWLYSFFMLCGIILLILI
jgi:hypothetical protein